MEEQLDWAGAEAAVSTQQDCVWALRAELENFCLKTPRYSAPAFLQTEPLQWLLTLILNLQSRPSLCVGQILHQYCIRYCSFFLVTSQGKSDLGLCCPRLSQIHFEQALGVRFSHTNSHCLVCSAWGWVQLCQDTEKGFLLPRVSCHPSVGLQESDVIDLLLKKLFASSYQEDTEHGDYVNICV